MKITDSIWFTCADGKLIGIVLGVDRITGEKKAYIGMGKGWCQFLDELNIMRFGTKFSVYVLEKLSFHFIDDESKGH